MDTTIRLLQYANVLGIFDIQEEFWYLDMVSKSISVHVWVSLLNWIKKSKEIIMFDHISGNSKVCKKITY
uniref:Uncharacterized protein n=1 Tax=Octopus bimaculoides TaxID=37653 RepID=A0A0L8G6A3_OCTBM